MCQTAKEIRENDIVVKDLMQYEEDYELEKSSGAKGNDSKQDRLYSNQARFTTACKEPKRKPDNNFFVQKQNIKNCGGGCLARFFYVHGFFYLC